MPSLSSRPLRPEPSACSQYLTPSEYHYNKSLALFGAHWIAFLKDPSSTWINHHTVLSRTSYFKHQTEYCAPSSGVPRVPGTQGPMPPFVCPSETIQTVCKAEANQPVQGPAPTPRYIHGGITSTAHQLWMEGCQLAFPAGTAEVHNLPGKWVGHTANAGGSGQHLGAMAPYHPLSVCHCASRSPIGVISIQRMQHWAQDNGWALETNTLTLLPIYFHILEEEPVVGNSVQEGMFLFLNNDIISKNIYILIA